MLLHYHISCHTCETYNAECEMDPSDVDGKTGLTRVISASDEQLASLEAIFARSKVVSSETVLYHGQGVEFDGESIFLPDCLDIEDSIVRDLSRRRLAVVDGTNPVLAVRVTDGAGLAHPDGADVISDNVFGTGGDEVNLRSQLEACSFGKLRVQAGANPPDPNEAAEGVVEVSIDVSLEGSSRVAVRNAVSSALQDLLGHALPGPYQHVMYILEETAGSDDTIDGGWAAYALINHWVS